MSNPSSWVFTVLRVPADSLHSLHTHMLHGEGQCRNEVCSSADSRPPLVRHHV